MADYIDDLLRALDDKGVQTSFARCLRELLEEQKVRNNRNEKGDHR